MAHGDVENESIQIKMSRRARLGLDDKAVFSHAVTADGLDFGPLDKEEAVKESMVRKGNFARSVEDQSDSRDRNQLVVSVFELIRQEETE